MLFKLAFMSLLNRKGSVIMTLLAIGVSTFVLLGIDHIRHQARDSFASTVSGTDLIVGARTGSLNLLLYSVFRMGTPTDNISWNAYQQITDQDDIAWAIPISLGDSHKGFRVLGTTRSYFEHFSYGNKRKLSLSDGQPFMDEFDAVLGSEVARTLGYTIGRKIALAHGLVSASFTIHNNTPFRVVGVLSPTGTSVDQTIHVSLAGIEAMHAAPKSGFRRSATESGVAEASTQERVPESITAFMLGLTSKMSTFRIQRAINDYPGEPLLAILPGVALTELWQMVGLFENILRLVSILVLIAAVLGLGAVLLTSVRERSHEIHLLRALGAPPYYLFALIQLEALLISLCGMLLGIACLSIGLVTAEDMLFTNFGLQLSPSGVSREGLFSMTLVLGAALVTAAIPSLRVYSQAKAYT